VEGRPQVHRRVGIDSKPEGGVDLAGQFDQPWWSATENGPCTQHLVKHGQVDRPPPGQPGRPHFGRGQRGRVLGGEQQQDREQAAKDKLEAIRRSMRGGSS